MERQPTSTNSPDGQSEKVRISETLPRVRGGLSTLLIQVFSVIFLLVALFLNKNSLFCVNNFFVILSVPLLGLFLIEFLQRFLYFFEEYRHLMTRYDKKSVNLIKDVFYFSPLGRYLFVCLFFTHIILLISFNESPCYFWYEMGFASIMTSIISSLFLSTLLNLKTGPLYLSFWIENSNGLDYGSSMAHSFFHGYIKLIVPKTGTSEKHLEELMKDYEAEHHVELEVYKLFILIPKSLYCPTSLQDSNMSPSIEESTSLRPQVRTVAGVQNRVYKNSVYKIRSNNNKRIYVCAEYATPLKTFRDVVHHNGEHSATYKKHKNDIVLHFYLTLEKVLKENTDCTDFVELIFYDDLDKNEHYKDVGQILLKRIKKLKKKAQDKHRKC